MKIASKEQNLVTSSDVYINLSSPERKRNQQDIYKYRELFQESASQS